MTKPMIHTFDADTAVPPVIGDITDEQSSVPESSGDWLADLAQARQRLLSTTVELVINLPGRWPKADGTEGFGVMKARVRVLTPEQDVRLQDEIRHLPKEQEEEGSTLATIAAAIKVTELDGRVIDSGPAGGIGPGIATLLGLPADTLPRNLVGAAIEDNPTALKMLAARIVRWLANPTPKDDTAAPDPFGG